MGDAGGGDEPGGCAMRVSLGGWNLMPSMLLYPLPLPPPLLDRGQRRARPDEHPQLPSISPAHRSSASCDMVREGGCTETFGGALPSAGAEPGSPAEGRLLSSSRAAAAAEEAERSSVESRRRSCRTRRFDGGILRAG